MTALAAGVAAALAVLLVAVPRAPALPRPVVTRGTVDRARGRAAQLALLDALVAELRSGADPVVALVTATAAHPAAVPRARAAALTRGDVAAALRADAVDAADPAGLRALAACWEVAAGTGAGLASSLSALAASARETERLRWELQAGLAEPRATALVLAALPLVGLALGTVLGAAPLGWLLGSGPGLAVLVAGLALEAVGAWWAWRIVASCEASL